MKLRNLMLIQEAKTASVVVGKDTSSNGSQQPDLLTRPTRPCQNEMDLHELWDPAIRHVSLHPCVPIGTSTTGNESKSWPMSAQETIHVMQHSLEGFSTRDLIFQESIHPYVLVRNKVMLCWIPKNSCTKFKRLAMRTVGISTWDAENTSEIHKKHEEIEVDQFPEQAIKQIIVDPQWKRVVVLRDPMERFVSGYIDKVVKTCWFKKDDNSCRKETVEDFFEFLRNNSLWGTNDHFSLQKNYCGFPKFWWIWNEFIYYESDTIAISSMQSLVPQIEAELFEHWPGNTSMWGESTNHTTQGTDERNSFVERICANATIMSRLKRELSPDYAFFNLPPSKICERT